MPQLKGEGIVLRSTNLGEWDKLLVIFALGHGKVRAVAKGARKVQSRYASVTQPFSHIRFTIYQGKSLYTLSQVEVIDGFRPLRDNLDKIAYGLYMMELVDLSLVDAQKHDDILSLLISYLHILSHSDRHELLLAFFELRLLSRLGFAMSVERCVECGEEAGVKLTPAVPGFLCHACSKGSAGLGAVTVSAQVMSLFAVLRQGDWRKVEALPDNTAGEQELAAIFSRIIGEKLERTPESHSFLTEIRRGIR